ncbi:MAG: phosphatidylserine decarboxylase family protein [Flavobacteriaceae bacterium]|nr:phosphatidylserine decarboxylase family protein [Flavobacteriaceae bacterium]|tara:strand:+ start:1327 stop:1977 length:651 start_codon:yes stop_codon:yes gene_type:complete
MFHKEGYKIIILSFFLTTAIVIFSDIYIENFYLRNGFQIFAILEFFFIIQFFRNPKRETVLNDNHVISSVDGKVVIVKKVYEKEYFKDERIQVSVFMSPLNVHVTRYPTSGIIKFSKYHPGKYLVAWLPKSSELNERTTVVIENKVFNEILYRQIAGAVARRIVNYAEIGKNIVQGNDSGFIKFGSRVDVFLPVDSNILVKVGDKVKGGLDIIAKK